MSWRVLVLLKSSKWGPWNIENCSGEGAWFKSWMLSSCCVNKDLSFCGLYGVLCVFCNVGQPGFTVWQELLTANSNLGYWSHRDQYSNTHMWQKFHLSWKITFLASYLFAHCLWQKVCKTKSNNTSLFLLTKEPSCPPSQGIPAVVRLTVTWHMWLCIEFGGKIYIPYLNKKCLTSVCLSYAKRPNRSITPKGRYCQSTEQHSIVQL